MLPWLLYRPLKELFATPLLETAALDRVGGAGSLLSTARCHWEINFDTPPYGLSGAGCPTCSEVALSSLQGPAPVVCSDGRDTTVSGCLFACGGEFPKAVL